MTKKTWVKVLGIDMYLDLNERIQESMSHEDYYDKDVTAWVHEFVKPGDTFIDCGASFGWFTALATQLVGPHGRVLSFEPSPIAFSILQMPYATGLYKQTSLYNQALGHVNGWVTLNMPLDETVHSPSPIEQPGNFYPWNSPIFTLDNHPAIKDIGYIDFIKIDVEGYEPNVLRGLSWLAKSNRIGRIAIEENEWWLDNNKTIDRHTGLDSIASLEKQLEDLGFELEKTSDWGWSGPDGDWRRIRDALFKHKEIKK